MKDIIKNIRTARKMPPKILIECVIRLAKRRVRSYTIQFHPVKLSNKDFLDATGYKTMDEILNKKLPPFFFNPRDKDKIVEVIKKEYSESIKETIMDADEVCNHIFDLLGSGKAELGKEIDWHLDFKSGFRWNPKGYYLGTGKHVDCYLDKEIYADVKIPWELSRSQHFVTLGKAYWYNKQCKMQNAQLTVKNMHWNL